MTDRAAVRYLVLLVCLWVAISALLVVLPSVGIDVGLTVPPISDDWNWIYILQDLSSAGVANTFWQIDHRNPLSPYWYLAAKPLILGVPYGLYLARHVMSLFSAIAVFVLVDRFGWGRHRFFAWSCAALTLLWNFSQTTLFIWMMVGTLAVSILSLWMYCRYVDSKRTESHALTISVLLYLVAIASYTLQASLPFAVLILGVFRAQGDASSDAGVVRRLGLATLDASMYGVALLIFLFLMNTVFAANVQEQLSMSLVTAQIGSSLQNLVWHWAYTSLVVTIIATWASPIRILIAVMIVMAFAVFFALVAQRIARSSGSCDGRSRRCGDDLSTAPALLSVIGCTLATLSSLAIATVILEATSPAWLPGSRSMLLQQVFSPLLYVGALFMITIPMMRWPVAGVAIRIGAMAILCGAALVAGLQYNAQLKQFGDSQLTFARELQKMVPDIRQPTTILVKVDDGLVAFTDFSSEAFAKAIYRSPLVNMRILRPGPAVTDWSDTSTVLFGADAQGVFAWSIDKQGARWVPYEQVVLLRYHGGKLTRLSGLDRSDLDGYHVGFLRDGPVTLRGGIPVSCGPGA